MNRMLQKLPEKRPKSNELLAKLTVSYFKFFLFSKYLINIFFFNNNRNFKLILKSLKIMNNRLIYLRIIV